MLLKTKQNILCVSEKTNMCSSSEALPILSHHPGRNESKCTIKEWDANTHEESNDDETKACAEGVYEREPVYPTLWWKNTKQRVYVYDKKNSDAVKRITNGQYEHRQVGELWY